MIKQTKLIYPLLALCIGIALSIFRGALATPEIISQEALLESQANQEPMLILDVRTPREFSEGHVPGAINIPHTEIGNQLSQIKTASSDGRPIVVYCWSGHRAGIAENILEKAGITNLRHLNGDMNGWMANRRPLAK